MAVDITELKAYADHDSVFMPDNIVCRCALVGWLMHTTEGRAIDRIFRTSTEGYLHICLNTAPIYADELAEYINNKLEAFDIASGLNDIQS